MPSHRSNDVCFMPVATGDAAVERIEWNRAAILDFIEDYRQQRVLWDSNTKGYHLKQIKFEALKLLANKYGTEVRCIRSKIKSLRSSFHREHGKVLAGRDRGQQYKPMWFAYEVMRFILDGETLEQERALTQALRQQNHCDALSTSSAALKQEAEAVTAELLAMPNAVVEGSMQMPHNNNNNMVKNNNHNNKQKKLKRKIKQATQEAINDKDAAAAAAAAVAHSIANFKQLSTADNAVDNDIDDNDDVDIDDDNNDDDVDDDDVDMHEVEVENKVIVDNELAIVAAATADIATNSTTKSFATSSPPSPDYLRAALHVQQQQQQLAAGCYLPVSATTANYQTSLAFSTVQFLKAKMAKMAAAAAAGINTSHNSNNNNINNNNNFDFNNANAFLFAHQNNNNASNNNNDNADVSIHATKTTASAVDAVTAAAAAAVSLYGSSTTTTNTSIPAANLPALLNLVAVNQHHNNNNNNSTRPQSQSQPRELLLYGDAGDSQPPCNIRAEDVKTELHEESVDYALMPIPLCNNNNSNNNNNNNNNNNIFKNLSKSNYSRRKRKQMPIQIDLDEMPSTSKKCATAVAAQQQLQKSAMSLSISSSCSATTTSNYNNRANNANSNKAADSQHAIAANNERAKSSADEMCKSKKHDEFAVYGDYVAITLRNLKASTAQVVTKHLINNILYEAELGKYDEGMPANNEPPQLYKM